MQPRLGFALAEESRATESGYKTAQSVHIESCIRIIDGTVFVHLNIIANADHKMINNEYHCFTSP